MRLDTFLGFRENISRTKARSLIDTGGVLVNGKTLMRASYFVKDCDEIVLLCDRLDVGRGATKLRHFLDIDLNAYECLDIGASTGGFTQVLLELGAKSVMSIDVGTNQFDEKLALDERITVKEKTDVRSFHAKEQFDLVVCDVSFIPLKAIIKDIDRLAKDHVVVLFKPQFEVGKNVKRDKKGRVIDEAAIRKSRKAFLRSCRKQGWHLYRYSKSLIKGKHGNEEIFYEFHKHPKE